MKKIPIYLITGYLGSGKTTLLNNLLKQDDSHIGLIVNDLGSVNIDAKLLKNKENLKKENMQMVELTNGCICCTLQDDFMKSIEELSLREHIDKILVEASGVSNPANIAAGFIQYQELIKTKCFLSDIISVVDSNYIYNKYYNDIINYNEDDNPDIINLIMDQIEFCNIIIMNKCDLIDEEKQNKVYELIKKIQPEAQIIKTCNSNVLLSEILGGKPLDFDKLMSSSSIVKAIEREEKMDETNPDYGIKSFVYERREPFDRDKFNAFIEKSSFENIIRVKGYIWFDDKPSEVYLLEYAGGEMTISNTGQWLAAFSKEEQEEIFKEYPETLEDWDTIYQDRLDQIVFIGKDLPRDAIVNGLDECLIEWK